MKPGYSVFILLALLVGCVTAEPKAGGAKLKLNESPRLWVSKDTARNLKDKLHNPYLKNHARRILEDADWLVDAKPLAQEEVRTNQRGTRTIASHLQCLTAAWVLTRDAKYRAAAIRHLANILNWKQVSCEASPHTPADRQMFFCLSYGEHAADIALMYDLFRPDITPAEQKVFFDVLDRFYLKEALRALTNPPWWVNKQWSNWNGVCAGGIGMMALAFYDDRPECRTLIPFVEESLGEYVKSYIKNGGGNHEGTGYWNYGMHYSMRYLLSWESATGLKHPAFQIKELAASLNFPLDFTGITFGDNDGWHPTGFFFMLTKRLNKPKAGLRAAAYLGDAPYAPREKRDRLARVATGDTLYAADSIPQTEMIESLKNMHAEKKEPVARVYKGLGWGILADDSIIPTLRLSARGGSSEITGHGHMDLLDFKCMVNGERMIEGQRGSGYTPVTFTDRGHHLYSRSAAAKSTLFVDGLGCRENAVCRATEVVKGEGLHGIRIDASRIYMKRWRRGFIGRLFLMVDNAYWLVIDTAPGHAMESRFHTYATVEVGKDWALLKKKDQEMAMTFASMGRGAMQQARGMPTFPAAQTQILRWMSRRSRNSLHVTALNPGSRKLDLKLTKEGSDGFIINVTGENGYQRTIHLNSKLQLANQ